MHLIIMWALLASLNLNDAFIIHYSQQRHNVTIPLQEEGRISCTCGQKTVVQNLPKDGLEKVLQGIRNHIFCSEHFETKICSLLKECSNCTAELRKCSPIFNTSIQFECTTKRLEKSDRFVMKLDPKAALEVMDLFGLKRKSRKVRSTCAYPKGLITADLICHEYPDLVLCKQKCLFGFTLEKGITREVSCFHSENVWKPTGFEECRPYINWSMSLLQEGEINCFTGTDEEFVYCNITCVEKNDKSQEVSSGFYRYQMNGNWSPKLPPCVTFGSGTDLVPATENQVYYIQIPLIIALSSLIMCLLVCLLRRKT